MHPINFRQLVVKVVVHLYDWSQTLQTRYQISRQNTGMGIYKLNASLFFSLNKLL
jgi:hypothetical protein